MSIKFFYDDGLKVDEIEQKLINHFANDVYKMSTIKKLITRFRWGKDDYEDEPRSGRPKDDQIEHNIKKMIDDDPLLSSRSISLTLNVSDWLVRDRLHNSIGMKCMNLKFVLHSLNFGQKEIRVEFAKQMLSLLELHIETGFKYILSGDESWFLYHYEGRTQRVFSKEELEERSR